MKKRPETKISKTLRENLLKLAAVYGKYEEINLPAVSARVYGNRQLLPGLAEGKSTTLSIVMYGEVIENFRRRWPRNLEWPMLPTIHIGRYSREK